MLTEMDAGKNASQSRIIVDLLRLVRTLRSEHAAHSELLGLSLELNRDLNGQLAGARARYMALLAQHRALVSGRTIAEERQALEDDPTLFDALGTGLGLAA